MTIVKRLYSATVQRMIRVAYICRECGFSAPLVMRGEGKGESESYGYGHYPHVAAKAAEAASEKALDEARKLVGLTPCPRCRRRKWPQVSAFIGQQLAVFIIIAALPVRVMAENKGWSSAALLLAALAMLSPLVFWRWSIKPLLLWKERAKFGDTSDPLPKGEEIIAPAPRSRPLIPMGDRWL